MLFLQEKAESHRQLILALGRDDRESHDRVHGRSSRHLGVSPRNSGGPYSSHLCDMKRKRPIVFRTSGTHRCALWSSSRASMYRTPHRNLASLGDGDRMLLRVRNVSPSCLSERSYPISRIIIRPSYRMEDREGMLFS